jgi:hypothetical protein
MKVIPSQDPNVKVHRLTGVLHSYVDPRYGLIYRRWPKKRGPKKTAAQQASVDQFTQAVAWTANPTIQELEAALQAALGTDYMWRDILEACCFGNVVQAVDKDGNFYGGYRMAVADIQSLLNTISNDIGSMLLRTSAGWVALQPGTGGYVLTSQGTSNPPIWLPASGGGGVSGGVKYWKATKTPQEIDYGSGLYQTLTGCSLEVGPFSQDTNLIINGSYSHTGDHPMYMCASIDSAPDGDAIWSITSSPQYGGQQYQGHLTGIPVLCPGDGTTHMLNIGTGFAGATDSVTFYWQATSVMLAGAESS